MVPNKTSDKVRSLGHCDKSRLDSWAEGEQLKKRCSVAGLSLELIVSLRHFPKQRLTCLVKWEGKQAVAKFFYGESYKKYFLREKSAAEALQGVSIPSAALLLAQEDEGTQIGCIVFEYLEGAVTVGEALVRCETDTARLTILNQSVTLLSEMHTAKLLQQDPHLDNFMVKEGKVYLIDVGQVVAEEREIHDAAALDNLALFLSQLPLQSDDLAWQTVGAYIKNRALSAVMTVEQWADLILKKRQWRERRFVHKKVFRSCSAFICKQDSRRFLMVNRGDYSDDMARALDNPDALFKDSQLMKKGRTATVGIVHVGQKQYVLKRYNIKKPIHSWVRGFKWSRAAVSWRNGHILQLFGIATAAPIAMIEERVGPLRRRSYLLTEYLEGVNVVDALNDPQRTTSDKQLLAKRLKTLFSELKIANVFHADCKAHNIVVGKAAVSFIDLDGMVLYRNKAAFEKAHQKDWQRFMRDIRGLTEQEGLFE